MHHAGVCYNYVAFLIRYIKACNQMVQPKAAARTVVITGDHHRAQRHPRRTARQFGHQRDWRRAAPDDSADWSRLRTPLARDAVRVRRRAVFKQTYRKTNNRTGSLSQ